MAYSVAATTIVLLAFLASAAVAFAHQLAVEGIKATASTAKRWSASVLIVVGVWFIVLGAFADLFARDFPV